MANYQNFTFKLTPMHDIGNSHLSCIYRIWFRSKYYIGKTKDLQIRINCHKCDLIRHVKNYVNQIINPYYESWIKHIIERKITEGFYEVLAVCKDETERVLFEQVWFNSCCDDIDCLNYGFESKPYIPKPSTAKAKPAKPVVKSKNKQAVAQAPKKPLNYSSRLAELKKKLKSI